MEGAGHGASDEGGERTAEENVDLMRGGEGGASDQVIIAKMVGEGGENGFQVASLTSQITEPPATGPSVPSCPRSNLQVGSSPGSEPPLAPPPGFQPLVTPVPTLSPLSKPPAATLLEPPAATLSMPPAAPESKPPVAPDSMPPAAPDSTVFFYCFFKDSII